MHPAKSDVLFSRGENMIYRSQEPLRILGDLSEDVVITVMKITKEEDIKIISEAFKIFDRLEKPLEAGDSCYFFMQTGYYWIRCFKRKKQEVFDGSVPISKATEL